MKILSSLLIRIRIYFRFSITIILSGVNKKYQQQLFLVNLLQAYHIPTHTLHWKMVRGRWYIRQIRSIIRRMLLTKHDVKLQHHLCVRLSCGHLLGVGVVFAVLGLVNMVNMSRLNNFLVQIRFRLNENIKTQWFQFCHRKLSKMGKDDTDEDS